MKIQKTLAASTCMCFALAAPAFSQETETFALPDQCSDMPVSEMDHSEPAQSMMDHDMDMPADGGRDAMVPDHVRRNMQRMRLTMPAMQQGMMQEDADIAFACGMIAHHQAAIDMARVVLDHGRDTDMRRLAEEIIEVQHEEIEYMTLWLEDAGN